jgi:hypothetical protein
LPTPPRISGYAAAAELSCCFGNGLDFVSVDDRMPWTGVFRGEAECEEFGFCRPPVPLRGQRGGNDGGTRSAAGRAWKAGPDGLDVP